jgi:hypothetical protein
MNSISDKPPDSAARRHTAKQSDYLTKWDVVYVLVRHMPKPRGGQRPQAPSLTQMFQPNWNGDARCNSVHAPSDLRVCALLKFASSVALEDAARLCAPAARCVEEDPLAEGAM